MKLYVFCNLNGEISSKLSLKRFVLFSQLPFIKGKSLGLVVTTKILYVVFFCN